MNTETTKTGPGTKLKELLASLGIIPTDRCPCVAFAKQMDEWGVVGCRKNRETIIQRLRLGKIQWGWSAKFRAGVLAVKTGLVWAVNPIDPIPGMVDFAIRKAEMEQKSD